MRATFEYRDPSKLKNHLLSIELYGESLDPEFMESVRRAGRILEPLRVLGKGSCYPEGTIVSGRRRRMAAMTLGLDKVPVIVEHDLKDKLDIDEQVILSNRPNERTKEQRAREYKKLKEIESDRAAKRMKEAPIRARAEEQKSLENKGEVGPVNLPDQLGDAGDIAADSVGMSRSTADKAVVVVDKIDELIANGETEKAEELKGKLESSVSAAHREVVPPKKKRKKSGTMKKNIGIDKGHLVREMKKLMGQVIKCLDARGKGPSHDRCNKAINEFLTAWEDWK